jgi:hypothetical protein
MRISKFQCAVVHFVNVIILINLLGSAFLPTYLMAQTTDDDDEERIQQISKGQWDGALGVKSFTLPGIDTATTNGHSYKQSDGTYDFSTIKMGDLFQGFSQAQHEAYAAELLDIQANPHKVQDAVYQMELDKDTYAHTECETLSTIDEQQRCELVKQANLLDEMRDNEGASQFLGQSDSLLTDFSSIADGTHPYYAELQNEECVETLVAGDDGEDVGITSRNVCIVAADVPEQVCKAERYLQSTKVGEKVVIKYPLEPDPAYRILADGFDAVDIRDCPGFDSSYRTCLEIDLLTTTLINDSPVASFSDKYERHELVIAPNAITVLDGIKRIRSYTVRSDHIAPNMILAANLGEFIDSPNEYVTDPYSNLFTFESGFYYHIKQQDDCSPQDIYEENCTQNEMLVDRFDDWGTAYDNADMFRYEYSEFQAIMVTPPHLIFGEYEPYQLDVNEVPSLVNNYGGTDGFNNTISGFTVSGETGVYDPPWQSHWSHIDTFHIHGYNPAEYNLFGDPNLPENSQFYNFSRVQVVFKGKFSSETADPPDPVDNSRTTIIQYLIDDLSTYPRIENFKVLGADVKAQIDVFDQGTYSLSDYFPTNLRVTGDSVVSYNVKTIGRPTNRYAYEIEIEFDSIAPFEVVADIHVIDDQGFRPRSDEDPNCQSVIDLYTTGTVNGTAVCDYEIAEGDGSIRISDDGVPIDWPHVGYFSFMPDWTPGGQHGLPSFCYDATINVDPSEFGGFASLDLEVACSGLEEDAYDACLRGEYCEEDAVNGGVSCHGIGEELKTTFESACGAYIAADNCSHKPNETRCEASIERDGASVCLYESHVFECETETDYNTIGTRDTTAVDCGSPRDCVYGECTNLAEESNDAFLRATAAMQVVQEAKSNTCAVDSGGETTNESSCHLFNGEAKRCKQPSVWGASDCCNPEDLGMATIDVVAYWKMYDLMDQIAERVDVAGYMAQAWDVVETTNTGAAIGEGLGAMSESITQLGSDAYSFMTKPIIAGWEATFQSLGFSPESEIVKSAADFFDMGTAIANGQAAAAGTTELGVQTASQTATTGSTTVGVVAEDSAITGIYAYIAHGINNMLVEMGYTELASSIFAVSADGSIGFNTGEGTWGSYLNTMSNIFGYVMLAYTIYNLYNLAVGMAFACDEEDFATTQKIKLLSTHYVGSWCSKKLFIGGCIEHSQAHCVYPSVFSRIISEEFRRIMAEDAGIDELDLWLKDPDSAIHKDNLECFGFTLDQVTNIDWDRVDLSEYEQVVLAKLKYDPNNMPEDFVRSNYMVEASGPQAGKTLKETGAAQAAVVGYSAEQNVESFNPEDTVLDDPDYMPWFDHGDSPGDSNHCIVSCDTANGYYYSTELALCVHTEKSDYPATFSCDTLNGYVLVEESANNFVCRKAETTPLTMGCRTGFVLDSATGQCTKDTVWYEEKLASCPNGYRLSDLADSCELVQTTSKVRNCSAYGPGFNLVDGVCQQIETEIATPFLSCSTSDYIIEDGDCVLRTEFPPAMGCSAPLEYNEVTGNCVEVSFDSMPATFSCDALGPDFVLSYGKCIKRTVATGTLTCDTDAGFVLVEGECQRTTAGTFEATTTCPDGYIADPNDTSKCFKRAQTAHRADPYCEDSTYTLVDNLYCEKVISETLPATPICLSGYTYDDASSLCVRVTRYPPTINCPATNMQYDAAVGLCRSITHESTPPTLTCNDGDVLDGANCTSNESAGYSISCPADYFYNSDSDSCVLQNLDRKTPSYWCPIGTSREGNRCYQYDYTEPTRSCDLPKVLNTATNMCEETIVISEPPMSLCPVPSYRDYSTGLCMVDETIPANIDCPVITDIPYTYNSVSGMCERNMVDEQLSVFICPPDEVECNTADEREPVPQCLNGSVNEVTGRCDDYAFTYPDAIAFCDNENHFYNASTNRCEYMETMNAVKCGPPLSPYFFYDGVSETCKHQNTIGQIADCVAGFTFDGTTCVRTVHTAMTCSDPSMTFDLALDRCVKTTVVPAVVACQPPYVVDPDNSSQCRLPPTHVPICNDEYVPVGYDNASDRCRHLGANTQHPAYLVCPAGSINQDNTHCYSGNTSNTTCPNNYSYNAATERCEFTPKQTLYCTGDTVLATDPVSGDLKCMYKEERRPICPSPNQYYDIAQNRCIIEDIVTGTMVCNDEPPFYRHLDGTQCMTVARVPYDAPDVCPDGYYPADPTYCEAQVTAQPPEFNCPPGYERNMADPVDTESPRCVRYLDSTPECDVGFTLVGNLCEQEHYVYDPIESCLYQGQTLFGSACTSGQQDVAPVCPNGYFYSSDYDICIELTEVTYTQSCLSTNFVLDVATGMCNSVYDEAPTCLTGYTLNTATNLCEQIYMPPVCDEANGFYYDTALDVCRKYETQPASFFCDPGERDDGDGCTPVQAPTCNDGWVFEPENDRCYRQENQPHEPNCESPYVDYGGECVLQQAVDCSIYSGGYWDAATETCNDPQTIPAIAEPCSGPNEVLIGDNCYETEAPQCPAYAPNYNPATDLCEGTGTTAAYIHCDTNEFDTGTGCTTRTTPTCSVGFVFEAANDRCYRVDTQPHEPNCGPGEIDFGGECIEEVPVDCSYYGQGAYWDPASQQCMVPDSQAAIPNGCGPNEILVGDTCYHTESPQCPSNAPNYNPVTKKCEGTSTYAGTPYCNNGDFDTGSGCTPQAPPSCSSGYVFNAAADICQKTESYAKGYECSSGNLDGTNCVEVAPINCPSGYADPDNDGVCTKRTASAAQHLCDNGETPPNCEQVTEYSASCPSGYSSYDNTTCSKTTETSSVPSCPSGLTYQHATNDCRDLSATSPAESCPGGDTDGNPSNGCTSVDNDSGRINCSSGYSYNSSARQCQKIEYTSKVCSSGSLQPDGSCITNHDLVEYCDSNKYSPATGFSTPTDCQYLWFGFDSYMAAFLISQGFQCTSEGLSDWECTKNEPKELVCLYDEVDGQCTEQHPNSSCPSGYASYNSTQCVRTVTQTPSCSGGYNWTGSTCSNTYDNGSYTQTCPSGEQLSGNQCYLPTTTYTCPSAHSFINNYAGSSNGDRCVQTTVDYQSKLCPTGGSLQSDGQCRTVTYGNDYYQCSTGILEGTECAVYDDQPGCDVGNGFVYYSGSNDCRRVSGANLESCPSGWTDNGSSCSRVLTDPPACNDGYYYEASTNLCHLTVPTDYYYNCGGDSYIGNGQCSASTSITPSCSSGYTFYGSSDHCRQNTGNPQTYSCPNASPGYTLNGQMCNREVPNAPYCPTGTFNAVKGTCTFNHHPYNPNCNSPFVDANGQCEQYFIDPPGCASGEYYNNTSKMCELVTETDYIYECYDNATQVYTGNGQCTFDTSSSPTCNQGFTLDSSGNYCLEDSGTQRPYSCPSATPSYTLNMGDMTCNRTVQNPPNCVNGSYDSALGTCVYGQKPHTPNCYSPYVDANGQCELYLPEPPICSPGYPTFNPTHDTCDATKESYNYVCDTANGFTPIAGDITMCEKTTLASSTCPVSGQVLDTTDDMCKTYSYSAKADQCDSLGFGSVRVGGNCQTYYGQGYVTCDSGYRVDYDVTRNHQVCHNAQTQASTTFCPFGYTSDGGSCIDVATNDVDYSCEPGWALEWTGTTFECRQFTGDVYPSYECLNPSSPLYDTEACRAQSVTDVGEVVYTCQGSGYVYNEEDQVCRLPAEGYPVNEYCENPFYILTPLTSDELTDDGRLYKCVYQYVDSVPANLSCPDAQPPYELRATGNCVRSEPTDSVVACNPGYVLSDDGTACTRNVVQESMPNITCPEPYEATYTGECLVTTISSATQTCDPAEPTTNDCAMEIDSSTGVDQYGEFASPVSISAGMPFEVSMTIACLEVGQACVLLGSSSASGDAIYINDAGNSIIVDDNATVAIFTVPSAIDITMLNRYHISRDYDNEVTILVNNMELDSQVVPGAFVFERTFKHAGLGEHSIVNFSSASIANYSSLPQEGHVYKPSCTAPSNLWPDLNLDNDLTIRNIGSSGGPVTSYSGTDYTDNVPPIPIYDSEWDLVNGVCEKLEIIDDIPPTLTCNGEVDTNGNCIDAVVYPATPTCIVTDGWEYNSLTFVCERTVIVEQPPSSYSCADSSHVLVDGMCQYSDGVLPVGEGCDDGYEYNSVTSSCGIYLVLTDEAVLCEDGDEQKQNVCFERQYITPDPACPTNTVDIGGGMCQGTVTEKVAPDVACSAGDIVGINCVEEEIYPAEVSCSDSSYQVLNNICYKDIIASTQTPTQTCIDGYTLDSDGMCRLELIVPANVECPDIEYSYNATSGLCERSNVQNYRPDLGCPIDGNAWVSVSSTSCELVTDSIAVTRACEDLSADDSGEQCRIQGTETHAPDFCESPYEFIEGQCTIYEYERPDISCPDIPGVKKVANGCMEVIKTTQVPVTSC